MQDPGLEAGHDYGKYVRDARNAGQEEIDSSFERVMEDSQRAHQCHEFLGQLMGKDSA